MRANPVAMCGVLLWIASVGVCRGASCPVPSASHPTIQAAVQDSGCTEIELESRVYSENFTIGRSLSLSGVSTATSIIAGRVEVTGASTIVPLVDLMVDASHTAAIGCFDKALDAHGGAQVRGNNLVIRNSAGAVCPIFMDGFEGGTTAAWSAAVP